MSIIIEDKPEYITMSQMALAVEVPLEIEEIWPEEWQQKVFKAA